MVDLTLPLDRLPDPLPIQPLQKPFDVTITPPGSKSITCRAYVLAALAKGRSRIVRPLHADDTNRLLAALCTLGADARLEGTDVLLEGVGGRFPRGGAINLGEGAAPTRFMIAASCLAAEPVTVDGSARMRQRPVAEGVELLRALGGKIDYVEAQDRLPVRVSPGTSFTGGELTIGRTHSSQFVSAIMLIAPCLTKPLKLWFGSSTTSASYVRLTAHVLEQWRVRLHDANHPDGRRSTFVYTGSIDPQDYEIEPDASSAVYWLAAAAISDRSRAAIGGLPPASPQSDVGFLHILEKTGALRDGHAEVAIRWCKPLRGIEVNMSQMPDAAMALSAIASTADSPSTISGLQTLRIKETDRIAALENELQRIGCTVETTDDSIRIDPATRHEEPVVIETYNDHRMAMAFGVLGLSRPGISIKNPSSVAKSYPTFWRDFALLYE